jgi:hypothetical protein
MFARTRTALHAARRLVVGCLAPGMVAGAASAQLPVSIVVPYHSQVPPNTNGYPQNWPFFEPGNPAMPNGYCTIACIDMLFNFFKDPAAHNGLRTPQVEIAAVANTNDPMGGALWVGTQTSDARRAVQFSSITAQWPNPPPQYVGPNVWAPRGYSWRTAAPSGTIFGWVGIDGDWGASGWTIAQLRSLLDAQVPLIVHVDPDSLRAYAKVDSQSSDRDYDVPAQSCQATVVGHSIVLNGYDNGRNVFTFLDPTRGPAWTLDQQKFWNVAWAGKKFLFVAPWRAAIQIPALGSWIPSAFVTTGTATYTDRLPGVGTGVHVQTNGKLWFLGLNPVAKLAVGQAATIAFNQVVTSGQSQQNTWNCVTQRWGTSPAQVETWGALQNAVASSFPNGYNDQIGAVESTSVTVPPPQVTFDPSICHLPRTWGWWYGLHLWSRPWSYAPGTISQLNVVVANRGTIPATGVVVRLLRGDPTTAECYPDTYLQPIGTITLPPIAPGDSVTSSPLPFMAPTGNSFGQPYYSFLAVAEAAGDPLHDQWVETENNIACRSYNHAQISPNSSTYLRFWVYNPQATSAWVVTKLSSDMPPGWSAHVEPTGIDSVLMAPRARGARMLVVSAGSAWQSTIDVCEYVYDTSGHFVRCTGGLAFFVSSAPVDVGPGGRPEHVELSVPFVTPGAPQIELSFSLPAERFVNLSLFDVRGSRIAALYRGIAPPGTTCVLWNQTTDGGSRVASGIYIVRLEAGKDALARKVLVVR